MNMFATLLLLVAGVAVAVGQPVCPPYGPLYPQCNHPFGPNWRVGVDHAGRRGTVVHGQANGQLGEGLGGSVHGQRVFGGPNNGAQSVGGGLNYNHPNGIGGQVEATHHRGQGTTYSGSVGGSTKVGPGTLSVGGGVSGGTGGKPQGSVGATYSVPLP